MLSSPYIGVALLFSVRNILLFPFARAKEPKGCHTPLLVLVMPLDHLVHPGRATRIHRMHANALGRPELGIRFEPAEDVVARGVSVVVDDAVRAAAGRLLFCEIVVQAGLFDVPGFQQRDSVVGRLDPLPSETAVLPRRACIVEPESHRLIQSSRIFNYRLSSSWCS